MTKRQLQRSMEESNIPFTFTHPKSIQHALLITQIRTAVSEDEFLLKSK